MYFNVNFNVFLNKKSAFVGELSLQTLIESELLGTLLWNHETQSEFPVVMASEEKHLLILREWDL